MPATQANQLLAIQTILGDDAFLLHSLSGEESLSALFRFEVVLHAENDAIDLAPLLGSVVDIRLHAAGGPPRHWNGRISRISQGGRGRKSTAYHAEIVPWLWFLRLRQDCRIFQNRSVTEIVQQVLTGAGYAEFEFRLAGELPKREYCVQYRESDFAFVSRLLEEEGIFYFFEHEQGRHVLVMANQTGAHPPCPVGPSASVAPASDGVPGEDTIAELRRQEQVVSARYALADDNFETPSARMSVVVEGDNEYEVYEYPGGYRTRPQGERLARIRREELAAQAVVLTGEGNCRRFAAGHHFQLRDHYRRDWNQEYVLVEVTHRATQADYFSGAGSDGGAAYHNRFTCIPRSSVFRPIRRTPTRVVDGPQTAVVVGPAGEEIHTDRYGRVKVQFHWDRRGTRDERSSCWIRVSQAWAGKGWGAMTIPRIGQEVVVDFLEGNPDRPIITGRVYNAECMPPFPLPAGAANSGVQSATIGGPGNNAVVMDDTRGAERVAIHAQRDMKTRVEHDDVLDVGSNRTETIGGNRAERVGRNETLTVRLLRTHNVGLNDMLNVGAAQEVTVGGAQAITVGLDRVVTVALSQQTNVGQHYTLEAGDSISFVTGDARFTLQSDGTIVLEGVHLVLRGSSTVTAEAERIDLN